MKIRYELYQIQPDSDCPFLFMGLDWLKRKRCQAEPIWYDRVDADVFETRVKVCDLRGYVLEALWQNYNPPVFASRIGRPLRSMSVSDVVLLEIGGEVSAWYCDSVGFRRLYGLGWEDVWKTAE